MKAKKRDNRITVTIPPQEVIFTEIGITINNKLVVEDKLYIGNAISAMATRRYLKLYPNANIRAVSTIYDGKNFLVGIDLYE